MNEPSENSPGFIKSWANKIKQINLTTPAILFLETQKPLSFVLGQFLLVGQPIMNTFLPAQFTHNAVDLFSNRRYLDDLIKELEGR